MKNIEVQREVLTNGGPGIGIAGNPSNHAAYNIAYDQYIADGDAAAARDSMEGLWQWETDLDNEATLRELLHRLVRPEHTGKQEMKAMTMHTLWALIEALSAPAAQQDAATVARAAGVELRQASENAYVVFYEASDVRLKNGVVIGKADVREFKHESKPPFIVLKDLQGACLDVPAIERELGLLTHPVPPSNPVPEALITRDATYKGRRIPLGFKWSKPECLSSVSINS